jgi:hypothetical protein
MTDDDKALVERLSDEADLCRNDGADDVASLLDDAADRIEALSAENERLIKAGDGDVGLIHWQGERIEQLEAALREIARLRTDLRGDFSLGSKQSDIARAALGETK